MISFKLIPENFNHLKTQYDIIKIDNKNVFRYTDLIKKTIDNFNNEIFWPDMFTLEQSLYRFELGMKIYIGHINNEPFGHVWFNNTYLFNLFVRNKIENKTYTGSEFLSDIIFRFYPDAIFLPLWLAVVVAVTRGCVVGLAARAERSSFSASRI